MFALLCYDAQTPPHIKCLVTKHSFFSFQWRRNFDPTGCFEVITLKNQIKRALKDKDVVNSNEEVGMTNGILPEDLINMKHRNNFYVGVLNRVCLPCLFNL